MGLEITNEDFAITITPTTGATPGTPVYVLTKAGKAKANSKFILVDKIQWTVTGCIQGAFSGGTTAPQSMAATAIHCKCDNKAVMRKDDQGTCTGTLVGPSSSIACGCTFKITNAGQTKAKGV